MDSWTPGSIAQAVLDLLRGGGWLLVGAGLFTFCFWSWTRRTPKGKP